MAPESVDVKASKWNPVPSLAGSGWTFCRDLIETVIYDGDEMRRLGQELERLDWVEGAPVRAAYYATHANVGRTWWISPTGVQITPPTDPQPAPVFATREAHAAFLKALEEIDAVWLPVVHDEPERLPEWVAEREAVLAAWNSVQGHPGRDRRAA